MSCDVLQNAYHVFAMSGFSGIGAALSIFERYLLWLYIYRFRALGAMNSFLHAIFVALVGYLSIVLFEVSI